jgi:hypothetical protein
MSGQKIIEAAWISYAERVIPATAPPVQYQECRRAFYAGAGGLFAGIMTVLDPGAEPTEADCARMESIQNELDGYLADLLRGKG